MDVIAHDLFTAQPIQGIHLRQISPNNVESLESYMLSGAHTYFFRHISHDFPDVLAAGILLETVKAMERSRSRNIVSDVVFLNVGASA